MAETVQDALDFLSQKEGFTIGPMLGKGTYGTVMEVIHKERGTLAAKIVKEILVNSLEVEEWPQLDHENILRLLTVITEGVSGFAVFLTHRLDTTLFDHLWSKKFRQNPSAPEHCCRYARDVLKGVVYLHQKQLCHRDLRTENILLTSVDHAVIADFSGLCSANELQKFCPLPRTLKPPEMLTNKKERVDPVPIDLWACGMLLACMFLGKGFQTYVFKNSKAGELEAVFQYVTLFQSKSFVKKFASETYPNAKISLLKQQELRSLIQMFLQFTPEDRISARAALQHSFLSTPLSLCCNSSCIPGTSSSQVPTSLSGSLNLELVLPTEAMEHSLRIQWKKYKIKIGKLQIPLKSPVLKKKKRKSDIKSREKG